MAVTYEVDFNSTDDWASIDEPPAQTPENTETSANETGAAQEAPVLDAGALDELEAALRESESARTESSESSTNDSSAKEPPKLETEGDAQPDANFIKQFESAFEQRFGVSVDDIIAILGGADELVRQSVVAQQEKQLREFWGDDYDTNFPLVVEKFKKLPEDLQEKYDNVEGAKLLWAIIQKERGAAASKKTVPQREQVKFLRGGATPATGGASAQWRMSEILELSPAEYAKNLPEIEAAFRENRVIRDVK